jgi:hypothetical protein
MLRHYCPLVVVLAAVCAGIVIDRHANLSMGIWLAVAVGGLIGWLLLWRRSLDLPAAVVLAVSLAAAGGAWHHIRWHYFSGDEIGLFAREHAEPVCLEAVAVTGPRLVPAPQYDPLRSMRPTDETRLAIRLLGIYPWPIVEGQTPSSGGALDFKGDKGEQVGARCHITRAMVINHDCDIAHEKQSRLVALIKPLAGISDEESRQNVRKNGNSRYLYLPAADFGPESYVDFQRITAMHPELLDPSKRLCSLTPDNVVSLQSQIVRFFIHQNLTILAPPSAT